MEKSRSVREDHYERQECRRTYLLWNAASTPQLTPGGQSILTSLSFYHFLQKEDFRYKEAGKVRVITKLDDSIVIIATIEVPE